MTTYMGLSVIVILVIVIAVGIYLYRGQQMKKAIPLSKFTSRGESSNMKPRSIQSVQDKAWAEITGAHSDNMHGNNHNKMNNHTDTAAMDYQSILVDQVADMQMKDNQDNWYSEVAPKSRTAMSVDDMDEASTLSAVPRRGIYAFRFAAPTQKDPMFITDQDHKSFRTHATQFRIGSEKK